MLKAGEKLRIEDVTTSRWEGFDSLARVHAVFTTLSKDPKLAEFAFIIHWDKYKPEQKREYYSKFACHELNFFLFRKDKAFFNEVVKPFLANKKEKTFLDHWLLGNSIVEYAKPWRFEQLNIVEKILLAQTLEAERTEVRKYVRDRERLLPPTWTSMSVCLTQVSIAVFYQNLARWVRSRNALFGSLANRQILRWLDKAL